MPSQVDMSAGELMPQPLRMENEQSSMGITYEGLAAGALHCHPAQLMQKSHVRNSERHTLHSVSMRSAALRHSV